MGSTYTREDGRKHGVGSLAMVHEHSGPVASAAYACGMVDACISHLEQVLGTADAYDRLAYEIMDRVHNRRLPEGA